MRLDYLYSTAFRVDYKSMDVQSNTIHSGLFYEIVLGDNDILVSYYCFFETEMQ